MEGVNSFEKGLHRSNSPQMQPEGSYIDALNWIRNDSGRLINEELENITHSFTDETILLGHCPLRNEFICFLKTYNTTTTIWNSIIGVFSEGKFTEIFNDKNHTYLLNFSNNIDSVARVISSGNRVVYFVEENNPIRRFDLDEYLYKPTNYDTYEDFNLQLTVKYPKVVTSVTSGGTLNASVYSFIVRYADSSNNKTPWNIPSRLVSVVPIGSSGVLEEIDGGAAPGVSTDKKITLTLTDTDKNYPFVEIGVITYTGIINELTTKTLITLKNSSTVNVTFSNNADLGNDIDLTNITDIPVYYTSAKCIEQKDNHLIISNLTGQAYDDDFNEIAKKIVVAYYFDTSATFDDKRSINCRGSDVANNTYAFQASNGTQGNGNYIGFGSTNDLGNIDQWYGIDGSTFVIQDTYNNTTNLYKDSSIKKGFQPGEVYSFSITPVYKDGSIGFAYHIPCNFTGSYGTQYNTTSSTKTMYYTKAYVSSIDYPESYGYPAKTKIRHHQLPYEFEPVTYINGTPCVNILRVAFFDINIPQNIKDKIQGYIIGYQERNSDSNKRVIDEGVAFPYQTDGTNWKNSFLDGYGVIYNWSIKNNYYAMYFSPNCDLDFVKIKSGYKFQTWAYGINYYYNNLSPAANKYFSNRSILRHVETSNKGNKYDVLFIDANKFDLGASSVPTGISFAEHHGNMGTSTTNIINGKFDISEASAFTHIECSSSNGLFYNSDGGIIIYNSFAEENNVGLRKKTVNIQNTSQNGTSSVGNTQRQSRIPMVRIINDLPNLYGSLDLAQYVVSEFIQDLNPNFIESVEGDTYTFKNWYNIRTGLKINNKYYSGDLVAGVWLRSQNNLALRHRDANNAPYYPKDKVFFQANNASQSIFGSNWWDRSFGYNKQYSAINNFKPNYPKPLFFSSNTSFTNRTIYSKQAFESELSDQYRLFPIAQLHDIPKDRGVITDTFIFNNNFYHHTEYGLWQSYFNPNTTQATSQGEIVLGNAGKFTIPSKIVLDIRGGYMGTMDKSGMNTPFGRIFIDHSQKKVFLFDGSSPVEISDLGLFSFFRENIDKNKLCSFGYDWKNKRILLSVTDKSYLGDLNTIVNNGPFVEFSNTSNGTLDTAKDLGNLSVGIKTRNRKTINDSLFFKITLNQAKYIIIDARIQGDVEMNIYKKAENNQFPIVKTRQLPLSTSYVVPDQYGYGTRYYNWARYIDLLDEGEYYIEFKRLNGFPLNDINILGKLAVDPNRYTISYYPKTQTWTSFHDFKVSSYLTINGSSYAFADNSFYDLSNSDGKRKESNITFIENTSPDSFKRFDKIEINTMSGGDQGVMSPGFVEPDNYIFNDQAFTHIHAWTDRQNTTELPFAYNHDFNTNFLLSYKVDEVPVNYYRSSFHAELPLDAVIDPYKNIFDSTNTDINADFRSHMKGKFLYTKLTYKDKFDSFGNFIKADKPLVLNYVKTYFKPSVA